MRRCILHVGAHKTGSSAIQDALFESLRDARFQYAAGGVPNGSILLSSLFDDTADRTFLFKLIGEPGGNFDRFRIKQEQQLQRAIQHAKLSNCDLIISSETAWLARTEVLERIRQYLNNCGFKVQVVAYVRPWASWISSLFVQRLRAGRSEFHIDNEQDRQIFDVRGNVERFRAVFGSENVLIFKFSPQEFPNGCVVNHFCGFIGMQVPEGVRFLSNESFTLPAVQLLYSFNKYGGRVSEDNPIKPARYGVLKNRLLKVPGPSFRFDKTALEAQLQLYREQDSWIEQELGFSLMDSDSVIADDSMVANEQDLFAFSRASLQWLAGQTGQPAIAPQLAGADTAREVAKQVDLLRLGHYRADELFDRLRRRCVTIMYDGGIGAE